MDRSCIRDLCKCCQQCAIYTIYDCINAVISSYLFIVSHAYIKNTQHIHKQTQRATEETKRTRTYVSSCDRKIGVLMVSVNWSSHCLRTHVCMRTPQQSSFARRFCCCCCRRWAIHTDTWARDKHKPNININEWVTKQGEWIHTQKKTCKNQQQQCNNRRQRMSRAQKKWYNCVVDWDSTHRLRGLNANTANQKDFSHEWSGALFIWTFHIRTVSIFHIFIRHITRLVAWYGESHSVLYCRSIWFVIVIKRERWRFIVF